jgi:hypothetical protein
MCDGPGWLQQSELYLLDVKWISASMSTAKKEVGWISTPKITDLYELRSVLGKGAFGEVVKAVEKDTG